MQIKPGHMLEILQEVFPECNALTLSMQTQLGELPEWDSMAAVNLQTMLLQQYGIEVPLELLADQTSIQEVTDFLQNPATSPVMY